MNLSKDPTTSKKMQTVIISPSQFPTGTVRPGPSASSIVRVPAALGPEVRWEPPETVYLAPSVFSFETFLPGFFVSLIF